MDQATQFGHLTDREAAIEFPRSRSSEPASSGPTASATGQTLAGPRAAGKWIGVQNGLGNIAGILAPFVTGVVIDRTGQSYWAFVVAGVMALAGAACWSLVVSRVEPIDWLPVSAPRGCAPAAA